MVWLCLIVGCGPQKASVSGRVTLDGQPIESGAILMAPAAGEGPSVTAAIVGGRYELNTSPGKKRVQISAPIVVEKRKAYDGPDAPWIEITRERLPPRFNTDSELILQVPPGTSTKDWELSSR
jgi:hypothetical protein